MNKKEILNLTKGELMLKLQANVFGLSAQEAEDRLKEYGWQPTTSLRDGLTKTIAWYRTDQSIGNTVPRQQQNVILAE